MSYYSVLFHVLLQKNMEKKKTIIRRHPDTRHACDPNLNQSDAMIKRG